MQTAQLIERIGLISGKLTGSIKECELLQIDLPNKLKGYIEEIAQDLDELSFELSKEVNQ